MSLTGKKALITGASRGIGRAIALAYAAEGADLVLTARSADALCDVAREIARLGRRVHCMSWDVRETSLVSQKLGQAWQAFDGLDIIVNNAAIVRLPADHPDPTAEALWDATMDTNLKGLYFLCEAAAERLPAQGHGVIINLSSDAGTRGAPNAYGISKWGVVGYTKGLAKRLSAHGIRVNGIAPGPVATGMMECPDGEPADWPAGPLGRYALPAEIADVAVFLASASSRAVFGQTIVVNSAND